MHTLCKHTIGVKSCQLIEVKNFTSNIALTYCGQKFTTCLFLTEKMVQSLHNAHGCLAISVRIRSM